IAKLVAHGGNRDEAFDRLESALAETDVSGVVTNLELLRWLVRHPVVRSGRTTTAFLTEYPPLSEPPPAAHGPWRGAWRLERPPPPPAPPAPRRGGGGRARGGCPPPAPRRSRPPSWTPSPRRRARSRAS